MKIIIDIPIDLYETIKKTEYYISGQRSGKMLSLTLLNAIKNGSPLEELSNELTSFREGIKDENVLIGFNMAIAILNKYLGE